MKQISMRGERTRRTAVPRLKGTMVAVVLAMMPAMAAWAADEGAVLQSVAYDGTLSAQASQVL
ncbi:hypothetical protein, partial [Ralstonia sp. 1138]|uniref:hypothetical protein n=1 Tax=Ralstonia sp. 1138 TaxID=3156423 RepID=UPI0033952115